MKSSDSTPRVLIVDDDPVSLRFLEAAVAQCDCIATTAASGNAALAANGAFALLLIDRRLPDIDGIELLHALRERGVVAPAIATSAEIDTALAAQLRAAGFVAVLEKPASVQGIIEIVARHLPKTASVLLDDIAALDSIGGDANALRALRGLLARELDELERDLIHGDLATDPIRLDERLHRLRASCGFCGASALAAAAAKLESALRSHGVATEIERNEFLDACRDTMATLRA